MLGSVLESLPEFPVAGVCQFLIAYQTWLFCKSKLLGRSDDLRHSPLREPLVFDTGYLFLIPFPGCRCTNSLDELMRRTLAARGQERS